MSDSVDSLTKDNILQACVAMLSHHEQIAVKLMDESDDSFRRITISEDRIYRISQILQCITVVIDTLCILL